MSNDQKMKRLEDMLRTKYGSDTYETVLREEFYMMRQQFEQKIGDMNRARTQESIKASKA